MATSKKTTSKKTPAKKVVKPAAKPRSDYKAGARVKVKRIDGKEYGGFVTRVKKTQTGAFIVVNIGTKQVPIVIEARPAKVRGY
jgi:hypothetical protein